MENGPDTKPAGCLLLCILSGAAAGLAALKLFNGMTMAWWLVMSPLYALALAILVMWLSIQKDK